MAGSEDFNAAEVARKEFATGFRGFDQYEVRAYLAKLAAEMGVLQERERGLRERLTEIERKRPSERVLADEEIETALGVEATKVIHAAREAGSEIRARAEENVARMLREAQAEAQAMRTEASGILAARTEEADAAAARIVDAAQQRGREMVGEAQAVRERMLRDLSRRRRHAEAQLQLLLGGRERIVEAFEHAVHAASATIAELQAVELSDLPPLESQSEGEGGAAGPESGSAPAAPESSADQPAADEATAAETEAEASTPAGSVPQGRRMAAVEAEPESPVPAPEPESNASAGGAVRPGDERRPGSLRLLRRRGEAQAPALEDDVEGVRIIRPESEAGELTAEAPDGPSADLAAAPEAEAEGAEVEGDTADAEGVDASPTDSQEAVSPEGAEEPGAPSADGTVDGDADADADADKAPTPVIELFARLRADRAAAVAEPAPAGSASTDEAGNTEESAGTDELVVTDQAVTDEAGTDEASGLDQEAAPGAVAEAPAPDDETAEGAADDPTAVDAGFEARDAALEDAERALARSLKRALSDEQNEVLDSLRRLKGTPRIEVLLPDPEVHVARYQRVAAGPLATAATVGAAAVESSSNVDVSSVARDVSVDELARGFADEVAGDLRARLERALDAGTSDAEGLVEMISAGYREWKSARTDPAARHHAVAAYSAAYYAASPENTLRWFVDPAEGGCPDCDDNALAGPTAKGTAYPTGQLHPPAHVGCRCLLRPLA